MAKSFGRRKSPNVHDRNFKMLRLLPRVVLPTSKVWGIASKNLDQGFESICVGAAWTNFLRCEPIQTAATIKTAEDIYDKAVSLDEWPDNDFDVDRQMGTSVRAGAEAVMGMGKLKSYVWSFTLQPALEWVLTMGPVVLGTDWYTSFDRPDRQGIIQIKRGARIEGGHAYLWRGADTKKALAYCCNSWGDRWGLSGNFAIPFRDLEKLILSEGEACSAVEKTLIAKELPVDIAVAENRLVVQA